MNVMLLPKAMQMVRGEHFAPWRRLQVSCEFVFNEEIFQVCAILLLCYLKDVIAEWATASFVTWRSLLGRRLRRLRCSRAYCLRSPRRLTCSSPGKRLCCLRYWTLLGGRLWRKMFKGVLFAQSASPGIVIVKRQLRRSLPGVCLLVNDCVARVVKPYLVDGCGTKLFKGVLPG